MSAPGRYDPFEALCALAEELVALAQLKTDLAEEPALREALRDLQKLRVRALAAADAPMVKCLDAVHHRLLACLKCAEPSCCCEHLKGARRVLGGVVAALDGEAAWPGAA